MKKSILAAMIFAASLFAITFSACSDDGDDNNDVAVTGITLSESGITLVAGGETATLTATVTPDNATDKTVTWTSSNTSVATVEDGVVTPVAEGTATITAKAGEQTATCAVTVVAKDADIVAVTGITLSESSITLVAGGETVTLTATVTPDNATDKTVTWTSSDTDVATVENGKITAVAEGTATITAKAGEQTAECAVTVTAAEEATVPVESITLNKTELTLNEGGVFQLTATVSPGDATDAEVRWEIDDDTIATLSDTGKVTAKKGGTATITASAGGKSAQCKLTVNAAPEGVKVWLSTSNVPEGSLGEKLTAVNTKFTEHSDVTISLSATDLVSSVKLHVCKLDSSGPNLYIKGEKGETSDSDYIEFTIEKDCTVSFNSSGCVARVTDDGDFEKTQEEVGLFSEELSAGTYKIYSTESNTACKIQFLIFSES